MATFSRTWRRRSPARWAWRVRPISAITRPCSRPFTARLRGALLMLVHIGQPEVAERIHNAWLRTLEDGVHTYDIYVEGKSKQKVGTKEFAQAVTARMGQKPQTLKA